MGSLFCLSFRVTNEGRTSRRLLPVLVLSGNSFPGGVRGRGIDGRRRPAGSGEEAQGPRQEESREEVSSSCDEPPRAAACVEMNIVVEAQPRSLDRFFMVNG